MIELNTIRLLTIVSLSALCTANENKEKKRYDGYDILIILNHTSLSKKYVHKVKFVSNFVHFISIYY